MFGWNGVDNLSNFSPAVTFSRQPSRSAVVGVLCTPRRGAPPPLNPLVGLLTVRVFTNSIKKLSKFFTFIVLQKSFYIFLSVLCYLSRTWQPISSPPLFTLWKFHTIWVGGVTERLWLGCRPDFVFLWVPATVSGGRLLLRRRDKSLEAQFWDSHLQFLTSPRPPELRFESWEANSSKK